MKAITIIASTVLMLQSAKTTQIRIKQHALIKDIDDDPMDLCLDEHENADTDVTAYTKAITEGKKFNIQKSNEVPDDLDSSNSPYYLALEQSELKKETKQ